MKREDGLDMIESPRQSRTREKDREREIQGLEQMKMVYDRMTRRSRSVMGVWRGHPARRHFGEFLDVDGQSAVDTLDSSPLWGNGGSHR